MDKTVRLWHVTRKECLCIFKHSDFVTSIEVHPRDDRFFLAGSLDQKLRLWSIPDKSVAYWANLPDMITAVAFTPDGNQSIAGCLNGLCVVFDTDGLKIQSQIHVRSARGKNAKGSKITGIDTTVHPPDSEHGVVKLLITSNDSRIRLYNFKDRTLEAKFRGNENATSQIHATFSNDGRYVICGSEDRRAYIWPLSPVLRDAEKRPVEVFEAHPSIVTTAVFAPTSTKQLLGFTGDLLYDLCNPPPITLVSRAPSVSSKQPTEEEKSRPEETGRGTPRNSVLLNQRKAEESPAYLARSTHPDGNIIVTADYNGCIKVFRQDCGYHKRPRELFEGSSSFSRRLRGRANSISRRSIASSIGKTPSDRILSWRNGVIGSLNNSSLDNLRNSLGLRTRSVSPSKSFRRSRRGSSTAQRQDTSRISVASPPQSPLRRARAQTNPNPFSGAPPSNERKQESDDSTPTGKPDQDPLWLEGDHSYMFWNKDQFAAQASRPRRPSLLEPNAGDIEGEAHSPSRMTSDISSHVDDGEEDEELSCSRCAGTNFRATRTKQGEQKLICVKCGSAPL